MLPATSRASGPSPAPLVCSGRLELATVWCHVVNNKRPNLVAKFPRDACKHELTHETHALTQSFTLYCVSVSARFPAIFGQRSEINVCSIAMSTFFSAACSSTAKLELRCQPELNVCGTSKNRTIRSGQSSGVGRFTGAECGGINVATVKTLSGSAFWQAALFAYNETKNSRPDVGLLRYKVDSCRLSRRG